LSLPEPTNQWLLCNGSAVSRTTYSNLFAVIGITFGIGNAFDTFNLPDFRSRFPMGSTGNTLSAGGNSTLTLNISQLPVHTHEEGSLTLSTVAAHTHVVTDPGHDHNGVTGSSGLLLSFVGSGNVPYSAGGSFTVATHTHSINTDYTGISLQPAGAHTHTINGTTSSVGLGQPINITPPHQTVHYIIRT
jgi:microcystin-dependent protein